METLYSERSRSSGTLNSDRREPASQDLLSRLNVVASKMVVSSSIQVPGRMMYTPPITKETQYIIPMWSLELGGE